MKNAIKNFYANLLDIQSYLTQLYYCYETIPNYYIQQTVHYKKTKHIKDDDTFMLSEESDLKMNSVLMYLLMYFIHLCEQLQKRRRLYTKNNRGR